MTSNDAMLGLLAFVATALTCAMFATKNPMLGFPSAIFWMILGADAYITSTTPWGDIYYYVFFACSMGMTIFSAFAAFGLREKHDAIGDEEDEGGIVDHSSDDEADSNSGTNNHDSPASTEELFYGKDAELVNRSQPSIRTQKLRERARARKTGG